MNVDPTLMTSEVRTGPAARPSARRWTDMLASADMSPWHRVCDTIDKLYGDLQGHANTAGDPQFNIFWANLEVLRPSVYSRAPVPVVSERFNDRKPIVRKAAEVIERAMVTVTAESGMHETLKLVRDDLALYARGVAWVRIADGSVEVEHIDREDFRHDPARKWREVGWVARRAWLTEAEVKELAPDLAESDMRKLGFRADPGAELKGEAKAGIWEIWHRGENRVVHVADDFADVLKEGKPPVELPGFFPCPRPAFGTISPRKLVPVPDMVYYRDQLDEINRVTARIGVLTELIKLKGFYDASAGDMRQAIETAFFNTADNALLVGVPNLGRLMQGSGGKLVEWFPAEQAAQVVQALVLIRRQLIEDVYQITGLSDIMRGSTVASETATAQQLKAQYGSVRVRERQDEMIRIARDIYGIAGEMLAEKVNPEKLLDMGQVTDLPKSAEIAKQVRALKGQAMQAAQTAVAQGVPPEQIEQGAQAVAQQVAGLEGQMTREDVVEFLRDEKLRPYALDVETDSTIQPDEDAEKQRRTEFLTAISSALGPLMQLTQAVPEAGGFAAAVLRFTANGFRAGRELQQPIDDFAEQLEAMAGQPRPDPNAAQREAGQAEMQIKQAELQIEGQAKQAQAQIDGMKAEAEVALKQAQADKTRTETMLLQQQGKDRAMAKLAEVEKAMAPPMQVVA